MWACSLSSYSLLVNLGNVDGLCVTVLAAIFHHKEAQRCAQIHELTNVLPTLPLHAHVLVLANHISVMVPFMDFEAIG